MLRFFRQLRQRVMATNKDQYICLTILPWGLVVFLALSCQPDSRWAGESEYKATRIWTGSGPDIGTGDISPDGKFFSDINWDTGDLSLVNLETKEAHDLTGQGYDDGGYAWMSAFSSGGDQLAYEWYDYDTGTHELRLFSIADSEIKVLVAADEQVMYMEPLDWTSDDTEILVAKQFTDGDWELGFVSAANGTYTSIIKLDWNAPGGITPFAYPGAELSHDGRFIGFDYRTPQSSSNDLFVVSVEQGRLMPLLEADGEDRFLAWSKDSRQVLFYSDRSGSPAFWVLDVDQGVPAGEPRLVLDEVRGATPIGLSRNGFIYGTREGDHNVHIAEVDLQTGRVLQPPWPVNSGAEGRHSVGDWSADGQSLLYIRFPDLPSTRESVVIHPLDDGEAREIFFPWNFHNKTGSVAWFAQNRILVDGNSPGYSGIHVFDMGSAEVSVPANYGDKGFFQRFKASADGSRLFVEIRQADPGLVAFETNTGKSERLFDGQIVPGSTAISPDQSALVFLQVNPSSKSPNLRLMNLADRTTETILEPPPGILSLPVVWTSDSSRILVGVTLSEGDKGLWSVDPRQLSDRKFIPLKEVVDRPMVVSPDGRHVAFQSGKALGSLYLLEGFR